MGRGSSDSLWDDLTAGLSQQEPPAPPTPEPPAVDQGAWKQSVEQAKISDSLGTVHDLGLRVFNETQSYSDRPDSNEPIDAARQKMAHSIINSDEKWGADREKWARTANPIEPSSDALKNPTVRGAYDSSMNAAREAYLSGNDPTNGALYSIQKPTNDRSNYVFARGNPEGVPISTQSGPYDNSYPNKQNMPSSKAWINTYRDK